MTLKLLPGGDAPVHSLEAEKAVLGTCLMQPATLQHIELTTADFYGEGHARIWQAMQYLAAEGTPVDGITLRQRLVDLGHLAVVGGDDYLLSLTDTIPTLENASHHARIVREKASQRGVIALGQRLAKAGASNDLLDAQTAVREAQRALDGANGKPAISWAWVSEAITTALKPVGVRLETGFQTLDTAIRGGIPMKRFVVLAGAPGASKTTLAVHLANKWERAGATVVYLAADEPAEGVLMRFGQLAGWNREGLEDDTEIGNSTRAGFANRMRGRRLVVLDPDEQRLSLEEAAHVLSQAADGPMRVLIVDSLQTVRCAAAAGLESVRERMDATVHVCKRIARSGALVLAISEMSRAGYSGKEPSDPLASAKESGSIEYGVSLFLALRTAKDAQGQYDVTVAKNRLGGEKPSLRLRLDFVTAALSEINAPMPATSTAVVDAGVFMEAVRKTLSGAKHPLSANTIRAVSEKGRDGILDAVARMEFNGELTKHRSGYWLAARGSPPE